MSNRVRVRSVTVLAVALLAGAGLVACTGDSGGDTPPKPSATSSGPAGSTDLAKAAADVTQQYLAPAQPAVLASAKGKVTGGVGGKVTTVPGTVDVLAVDAGPASTSVRWRLSSDTPLENLSLTLYSDPSWAVNDTSAITLESKQANLRLFSSHWEGLQPFSADCTCAFLPANLSVAGGVELSNLYPALPESATEVQFRVPGFPAITANVTRS